MKAKAKARVANKAALPKPESGPELLRKAIRQPGVADMVQVYETWRKYERPISDFESANTIREVTSLSSSSGPALCPAS
jgi:hypothetical protein